MWVGETFAEVVEVMQLLFGTGMGKGVVKKLVVGVGGSDVRSLPAFCGAQ